MISEKRMNNGRVLVIDDDLSTVELVCQALEIAGYNVKGVTDANEIKGILTKNAYETILTDINMPQISGIEFLEYVNQVDEKLPVILMTGYSDTHYLMSAIKLGAYDFIKKPFNMDELIITVNHAVAKRRLELRYEEYHDMLEEMVLKRTDELMKANKTIETNLVKTILAMVNALEASDTYTRGHSERVTAVSMLILEQLKLADKKNMKMLRLGAILHDIGKIGIEPNILNKPSRLNDQEYQIIKNHPAIGYNIISPIELNNEVFNIVRQHHERVDGKGYPNNIKGDKISILARIVSVADTYDAITSDRAYRKGKSKEFAFDEINKYSGTQFDPEVVKALNKLFNDIDGKILSTLKVI
jgi:putative nucleotidyltransferase with HDIG domain